MAKIDTQFEGLVDKLLEDFNENLCFEIADEHMPMESDEEADKFDKEYKKAIEYAIQELQAKIKNY